MPVLTPGSKVRDSRDKQGRTFQFETYSADGQFVCCLARGLDNDGEQYVYGHIIPVQFAVSV